MQVVSGEEFLRWAAGVGVGFDPRYPDYLTILPPADHTRFWVVPADPATWPHFAIALLDGLDGWAAGYLWPRAGIWPQAARSESSNERVRDVVLRGAGIPDGRACAVRFDRAEENLVVAVLFATMAFGWCGADDLFFVLDHARQVVRTDHHDVLHAVCASEERVRELVEHMAAAGFALPTVPPDWTVKRPAWMVSG
jgi:hypothetical protein